MEEKNQEPPKMSEFCEAIMERTSDLNELKTERDCALVLCSDGDTLACRISGSPNRIVNILLKKMIADKQFAQVMSTAVHGYIIHLSNYLAGPDPDYGISVNESAKEIQMN